jgi:hypothetical protein
MQSCRPYGRVTHIRRTTLSEHGQIVTGAWLEAASPEAVYNWLDKRSHHPDKRMISEQEIDALEERLLKRNDPIIDLGLASFGLSLKVARALFQGDKENSDAVRLAILANATLSEKTFSGLPFGLFNDALFDKDVIAAWLRQAPLIQIEALVGNPEVSDEFLNDLLSQTGCWSSVPEDAHLAALLELARNPRLGKVYSGLGGYAEYDFGRIESGIWKLTATAPVTPPWAYRIGQLLEKVDEYKIENAANVARRWFPTPEFSSFEKVDVEIGVLGDFQIIRFYLARTELHSTNGNGGFLENTDIAFRCAAYSRLVLSDVDLRAAFARDGAYVFEYASMNEEIWKHGDLRTTLRGLARASEALWEVNVHKFNRLEKVHRTEHPEWFEETRIDQFFASDVAPSRNDLWHLTQFIDKKFEQVNTPINSRYEMLEKQIANLNGKITLLMVLVAALSGLILILHK